MNNCFHSFVEGGKKKGKEKVCGRWKCSRSGPSFSQRGAIIYSLISLKWIFSTILKRVTPFLSPLKPVGLEECKSTKDGTLRAKLNPWVQHFRAWRFTFQSAVEAWSYWEPWHSGIKGLCLFLPPLLRAIWLFSRALCGFFGLLPFISPQPSLWHFLLRVSLSLFLLWLCQPAP